jgi:hypothetical protein
MMISILSVVYSVARSRVPSRLISPGAPTLAVTLSHEGDPVGMAPREETEAIVSLDFEAGMRAASVSASFRHTHLAWFPASSAVEDPGMGRPTWIATINGRVHRVILVQEIREGSVPIWRKAWLLRLGSFLGSGP